MFINWHRSIKKKYDINDCWCKASPQAKYLPSLPLIVIFCILKLFDIHLKLRLASISWPKFDKEDKQTGWSKCFILSLWQLPSDACMITIQLSSTHFSILGAVCLLCYAVWIRNKVSNVDTELQGSNLYFKILANTHICTGHLTMLCYIRNCFVSQLGK